MIGFNIELEFLDLTWMVDVEMIEGFDNGDPRDYIESRLVNWSVDSIFYNNGWSEFSADTVKQLTLKHYKELREQILIEVLEG